MRQARTNDIWRKLFARQDLPFRKISLKFSGITELGNGEFSVMSPISILCGENGVGKSSLLWTIYRALCPDANAGGAHRAHPPKLPSGVVEGLEITLNLPDGVVSITDPKEAYRKLDAEDDSPPVVFIDPTFQVPELVRTIRADNNFPDLLEGVEPFVLDVEKLELVRFLVGKAYDKISVYEIDDYAQYEVFPYFKVEEGGLTYGSENMGLGELSLLYTFWSLSTIEKPSIVLLEEPETFAAPRSQRALIDMAAMICSQKKLFILISSHSGIIAERVPNTHLNLVTRVRENILIARNPGAHLLVERLGLFSYKTAVLLVEDVSARSFLKAILLYSNSRMAASCEIAIAGSDSEITTALKSVPRQDLRRFRLVGVYDGDARSNPDVKDAVVDWPKLFLPGDTCPELMIQAHLRDIGFAAAARELGKSEVEVGTAIGGAAGRNHHDWLTEVCSSLRMTIDDFFDRLAPTWIQTHQALADAFLKDIRDALL